MTYSRFLGRAFSGRMPRECGAAAERGNAEKGKRFWGEVDEAEIWVVAHRASLMQWVVWGTCVLKLRAGEGRGKLDSAADFEKRTAF